MNYPWYSKVPKNSNLQQGDIVENLAIPVAQYTFEDSKNRAEDIESEWKIADWIVLTQSCDLNPATNRGLDSIMVCPIFDYNKFIEDNPAYSSKDKKHAVLHNKEIGLHALKTTGYNNLASCPYIVNLRDAKIVSLQVVLKHINSSRKKTRLRLNSPYVEQMAVRFGLLFSRIGYPIDFPTKEELKG